MSELITSTQNRRIVEARKLDQRKHREAQGRFLAEGLQSLHMAADAGHVPLEVMYCTELFTGREAPVLLDRFGAAGASLVPVAAHVLQTLSDRSAPQGLVAAFPLLDARLEDVPLAGRALVLVLDRPQDPGNLGTLIRTADAVGAAAVALIEPCVDPFDPKVVRSTMGSIFNLPLIRVTGPAGLLAALRGAGLRIVGTDVGQGRWDADLWPGSAALVLGNEARGLSADVRPLVDAWAHLPMAGKAESLNVAVAGGILMYDWLRANLPEG